MARVPAEEIERLKREVSVERLAEARGVELEKRGADLHGLCPFHDDKDPSLVISPSKNLWHCLGACQAGGSPIDWVMKAEGVSFRHAVELLREGMPAPTARAARKLPPPVDLEAGDRALMRQVVGYYHETLLDSPEALDYLASRGIADEEAIRSFQLGFANRTLGLRLPTRDSKAGREVRDQLQKLGIVRASGHEHFNGSLVIPVVDIGGEVVEMYGRKVTRGTKLRKGTPDHLYLPGPHAGVWNLPALAASKEVIVCESLIDALTFWCAGFRNVTAAYGVNGFTQDHHEVLLAYGIERVLIAYDRDEAGERAAAKLADRLMKEGIACWRVQFPRGMDANEYAVKVTPAAKSLDLVLRKAVLLGPEGAEREASAAATLPEAPAVRSASRPRELPHGGGWASPSAAGDAPEVGPARPAQARVEARPATKAAKEKTAAAPPSSLAASSSAAAGAATAAASPASVLPAPPAAPVPVEVREHEVLIGLGDRRYRVRGLSKNLSYEVLRINLFAGRGDGEDGRFHVDTLDLYAAKQRASFIKQASLELGLDPQVMKRDVGQVLLALEALQDEQIKRALEPEVKSAAMTAEAREEALELLGTPDLLGQIAADFAACGVVGESVNTLTGYLAAISRKLERPLAVIVQSSSAAGKSSLMDAVLAFVPEEERVSYSAMTGQSLFYMGETNLRHKVLAVAEEEGAERASYALKLLQSEGELTIASTGKDPSTGKHITHEYRVEGPVAIMLTTTAIDVDEELLNRCLVLAVDEGRAQTRAIHRAQREKRTLEGLLAAEKRKTVLRRHRNAQRLLRPLRVLNPYAPQLTFPGERTRARRDHEKYLGLIDAIALLHQHQREVKTVEHEGEAIEYIEVAPSDIAAANGLAHEVLGRTLDELPPQTRRVLLQVERFVEEGCEREAVDARDYRFSRRSLREWSGLADTQLRVHLGRLVDLEYLYVHQGSRGRSYVYELSHVPTGSDRRHLAGLITVDSLGEGTESGAKNAGSRPNLAGVGGALRGEVAGSGGVAQAGDPSGTYAQPRGERGVRGVHFAGDQKNVSSYPGGSRSRLVASSSAAERR